MMVQDGQLQQLTSRVYELYGHDFRGYSSGTMQRQIEHTMAKYQYHDFDTFLQDLDSPNIFACLFDRLSINVTAMFRNPQVFAYLRQEVIPKLAQNQHIRIWCAGVATGEEAWSLAILLKEAGLLHRSLIYATDFNTQVLAQAKTGEVRLSAMADYTKNYINSGGENSFSSYYTTNDTHAQFDPSLADSIIFAAHNLVTDKVFNEFHLILCRNVLIYFNPQLTHEALQVFNNSLVSGGYLLLGDQESFGSSTSSHGFLCMQPQHKLYKKTLTSTPEDNQ